MKREESSRRTGAGRPTRHADSAGRGRKKSNRKSRMKSPGIKTKKTFLPELIVK